MAQTEQREWTDENLAALFDRFFPPLYDLAVRVVQSPEEAGVVLGRTFARAAAELGRRDLDELRPWVFGLAAAELPRKRPAQPSGTHAFARIAPDRLSSPPLLGDEQVVESVWTKAAALPVDDYLLLDLQLRHGLRDSELARALRLDARTVEHRLERLRGQLEEAVDSPISPVAVFAALAPVDPPAGLAEGVWAGLRRPPAAPPPRERRGPQVTVPRRAILIAALAAVLAGAASSGVYLLARGPGVHGPSSVRSTSHRLEQASANPDVTVTWEPSSDARGYSISWSRAPETPDTAVDLHASAGSTTGHLKPGTSWFNLRTLGTNGHWTSTAHLGPFLILPDTVVPQTAISDGPRRFGRADVTFRFDSNERDATLECSLDRDRFTLCVSPKSYLRLRRGRHTFRVRAVDGAGNVDPTPARRSWVVDAEPPHTELTSSPADFSQGRARFVFRSSERHSAFECQLDKGMFTRCKSPKTYAGLDDGPHRFRVRAVDRAGNPDVSPAARRWTVDTLPPETAFEHGPPHVSHRAAATFTLASEAGATFECRLDRGAWSDCGRVTGLRDGTHVVRARATDLARNVDPTPARWFWTVDLPPDTTITAAPAAAASSRSATFRFSSPDSAATFQCRLDARDWTPCASGRSYSGLSEGAHTFRVRAEDTGGTVDRTPATRTWKVDTVAPNTAITSAPKASTRARTATFGFSSSESGAGFQCRLDGGAWQRCSSPRSYGGLAKGNHLFRVRAVDAAGNADASPAARSWTIH